MQDGKLKLHFYSINTDLEHFQYDTFVGMFGGRTRLTFCLDQDGTVAEFQCAWHGVQTDGHRKDRESMRFGYMENLMANLKLIGGPLFLVVSS